MWMRICIQSITGSLQTISRDQTLMPQNPFALDASKRSSVKDVTWKMSNCESISSTGKHSDWLSSQVIFVVTWIQTHWVFSLTPQAREYSQRCQSQLSHRHQSTLLEWWGSDSQHVRVAWPLSSRIWRGPEWICAGLFQWWPRPLLLPWGKTAFILINTKLQYAYTLLILEFYGQ